MVGRRTMGTNTAKMICKCVWRLESTGEYAVSQSVHAYSVKTVILSFVHNLEPTT